jgi:DNA transformation protein
MPNESFKEFVLDQLRALPDLRAKAMFGGHGLYQAARFFGLLMDGRLYFKTDDESRTAYIERSMASFIYEKAKRTMTMKYFEVPPEVLENREDLVAWAQRAIQASGARSEDAPDKLEETGNGNSTRSRAPHDDEDH